MKTKILLINAFAMALSLASCKKETGPEGPQGAQGPTGPVLTGNLKGFVSHYDLSGSKIITNLAGDSVSIDGTSNVSVTDALGMYTFSGLSTGVYNLTIKRSGYGFTKLQDVQFTGGGDTYRNANLSKIPTNNILSFSTIDTVVAGVNYIRLRGTIPTATITQSIVFFVGIPGNGTVNSNTLNESNQYVMNIAPTINAVTSFKKDIPTSDLYDLGYVSTNIAYFAAYTIGGNTNASSYTDLTNNKPVFTALGSTALFANAPVQ